MALALPIAFTSVASAATTTAPVTLTGAPDPLTQCSGKIGQDSSSINQLDYTFSCSLLPGVTAPTGNTGDIVSYSILAVRQQDAGNNISDVNPSPVAFLPNSAGTAASDTADSEAASLECFGSTGDGFGCSPGEASTTNYGYIPAGDFVEGSLNLSEPYCPYLPEGAKPGTPAVPRATIELVVTDTTGAEDGPFPLNLGKACPAVPVVVPAFELSSLRVNGGSVAIKSDLVFTGKLSAELLHSGKVVGTESKKVTKTGTNSLSVKLNAAGRALIKKDGAITATVKATYTPTGGNAEHTSRSLKIK